MSVSINCIFLFFFFLFNSTQPISSSSSQTSPLFLQPSLLPNKSSSPSTSPSPSPSPHIHHPRKHKHKHKHNYPANLFFPSDPSPPPNSVPVLPANVSSPTLSNTTTSSKSSSKLIVIVISLAVFLLLVLLIAALIIFRRKNTDTKVDRSDSIRLYPRNTSVSDSKSPPRSLPFDSPELRPLPPLPKENLSGKQYYYNTAYEGTREEFFSPIGFSGSPNAVVSSTGSVTGAQISRSHSLNSEISSYPSSSSVSYSRTISRCLSIPSNSTASKNLPATLRQHEMRIFTESPTPQRNSMYTHNSDEILSYGSVPLPPIPPSLPPPRFSKMWRQIQDSPELEIPAKPSAELQTRGKNNECGETSDQNVKPRLKALHWDKVRPSSDRAMVWDKLKSTSFQLNEEMIETLFIVNSSNLNRNDKISPPLFPLAKQEKRVLDLKKSQNIAIFLKALNVTIDEVCEALLEGNTDTLGTEFLECLLKMAPSKAEELKLRDFEETSLLKLGPAEKFLKAILDIPFAFQRINAMLYVANFDSEAEDLIRSFKILEAACEELRSSRMFKKLLEAVLKTGNRMNVGTNLGDAAAFRLDTLLKLVDVKGTDGKTTLLHFVVQEIVRTEINQQSALSEETEFRKLGLQLVSSLSRELTNVIKSAALELDILNTEVVKLSTGITRVVEVIKLDRELKLSESSTKFSNSMNGFLKKAKEEIIRIHARQSVTLSLVKEITEYFYGNSAIEEAHPFRVFLVVRDFLSILDQVCREVGNMNERNVINSVRRVPLTVSKDHPSVFRGVNRIQQDCSSDDESF